MRFKAVIFDLDGTLVSASEGYRMLVMNRVFAELGRRFPDKEEIDQFWFMHSRDNIIRRWGIEPDDFWKAFRHHDKPKLRKRNTFAFEDIDYIEKLKKRGIKTAIYTGARPDIADMELDMIGKELFDAIVVAHPDNGFSSKPSPDGAIECLRRLGIKSKDAAYVGNADEDILAARNACIFSVLIDRKEQKNVLKPDMVIERLYELENIL